MSLGHHQGLQRLFGGSFWEGAFLAAISRAQLFLLGCHKDPEAVRLVRQVRRERRSLLTAYELYMVYSIPAACRCLPGAMAEVGVFQGSSARLLCEVKGDRPLLLFDTFAGLPKASAVDGPVHRENQYACSLESVQSYLKGFQNVSYHKGLFPESTQGVPDQQYCFAHFDVDLYESTLACLRYFYPKMAPGGIILSHDYSLLAGVKAAFSEFLADKPERPIELPSTQCMLVKLP